MDVAGGFFLRDAVFFLKNSHELFVLSCDSGKFIVHQFSPMMHGLAPPLLPLPFYAIPVHFVSLSCFQAFVRRVTPFATRREPLQSHVEKYTQVYNEA